MAIVCSAIAIATTDSETEMSALCMSNIEALADDVEDPNEARGLYLHRYTLEKDGVDKACCESRSSTDRCNYKHEYNCK